MSPVCLPLGEREGVARELVTCPVDQQRMVVERWVKTYGQDMAHHLQTLGRAFILYPENVAEFRRTWAADNVTDSDIRSAVQKLSDEDIRRASGGLRAVFVHRPDELGEVWTLVIGMSLEEAS